MKMSIIHVFLYYGTLSEAPGLPEVIVSQFQALPPPGNHGEIVSSITGPWAP